LREGPRVRIHLPPVQSQRRTSPPAFWRRSRDPPLRGMFRLRASGPRRSQRPARCRFNQGTFAGRGARARRAESGHSAVLQANGSMQPGSRYHNLTRAAVGVLQLRGLVIASRCGEVRRRRAELAKYDTRRSTSRRLRDDMRRCTIRRPRELASEVAKIASWLRRLEPPARATRCAVVFGLPVRSTEPGSCRLPDWWPREPQQGSHCRYWPHRLRHDSNLRAPASRTVALIHLDFGQVEAWQPAAQKNRFSRPAPPTVSGAARARSLALAVEARFPAMTRAPERRQPRCQYQERRQLSSDASYAAAGLLQQEANPAWPWSYWNDQVLDQPLQRDANPRSASFGSAPCPAAIALRGFARDSARVGTLVRSLLLHPQIPKTSCAEIEISMQPIFRGHPVFLGQNLPSGVLDVIPRRRSRQAV